MGTASFNSIVIPRPVSKRQLSIPAGMPIDLTKAALKITNYSQSQTNPFLNSTDMNMPANKHTFAHSPIHNITTKICSTSPRLLKCQSISDTETISQTLDEKNVLFNQFTYNHNNVAMLLNQEILDHLVDEENDSLMLSSGSLFQQKFNIENVLKTRSFSETELFKLETTIKYQKHSKYKNIKNSEQQNLCNYTTVTVDNIVNPFKCGLEKTMSAINLGQLTRNHENYFNESHKWKFGKQQSINLSSPTTLLNSQCPEINDISWSNLNINRTISLDSLNSESSVILSDLEPKTPLVTGLLCVGLQYDR